MNQFAHPALFWLLLLPLIFRALLPAVKGLHGDALRVPFLNDLQKIAIKAGEIWQFSSGQHNKFPLQAMLLWLVWFLLVVTAARPQWVGQPIRLRSESRDILMVMDISTSMLEPDFALNGRRTDRLTAVKKTAQDFIDQRREDRIGLILFGTNAYLQSPLTYDKKSVSEILWAMEAGMAGQSTAIGDALGLALKSMQDQNKKDQKIIILLTDGENNDGQLSLPQAIRLARDEGVKIYTIGVGTDSGFAASLMGFQIGGGSGLDERSLKEIAQETQGRYFRARDTQSLEKIYAAIDDLEPTDEDQQFVQETYDWFYVPLLLAWLLTIGWIGLYRRQNHE